MFGEASSCKTFDVDSRVTVRDALNQENNISAALRAALVATAHH